jgi:hypothetical protein
MQEIPERRLNSICDPLALTSHSFSWFGSLVVNPDGTTTAWNKEKTKVLHSHGPPARTG